MLCFRAPGRALPAAALLARAAPGLAPADRRALLGRGGLREARPGPRGPRPLGAVRAGGSVAPGTLLLLDAAADVAAPAPALPTGAGLGLAPEPPWPAARRRGPRGAVALRRGAVRAGVAVVHVALEGDATVADALALAAALGTPLLGDARRGGVLVAGGLHLVAADAGMEPARAEPPAWPDEPVFAPDAREDPEAGVLGVSAATARALRGGHPWVRPDAATGDPGRFRAGAVVRLVPPRGAVLGLARVEGPGPVAARLWAPGARRPRDAASVEARVHAALARRKTLLEAARAGRTDAFRLLHGEADGLPGLAVDRLGGLLRLLVTGRAALPLRRRAVDALLGGLGLALPVVEVVHLQPAPRDAVLEAVSAFRGAPPVGPSTVREDGLTFRVDAGLAEPGRPRPGSGLFLDQRANRARLRARARPGGRYLNLFAHTGAFSVALLAAGAGEAVSVDLSAPYLAWLEANLAANAGRTGLDPARHHAVRGDARRFVETLDAAARFDGIVVDPPTAAAAGRRFWSAERGLAQLLAGALPHLAPGGWLLVCRNAQRPRGRLHDLVAQAGREAGRRLALEEAGPGEDFPRLRGFPEGDPFEGVLATARG